jgi:hypothetical protein
MPKMRVRISTERFTIPVGQRVQELSGDIAKAFHLGNHKSPFHQSSTPFHQDNITHLHPSIGCAANFAEAAFHGLGAFKDEIKEGWEENGHVFSSHGVCGYELTWKNQMLFIPTASCNPTLERACTQAWGVRSVNSKLQS